MPSRLPRPGRPVRANLLAAVATSLTAALLTACSSPEEPDVVLGPDASASAPSGSETAAPEPTDPAEDQRALRSLTNRYDRALATIARSRAADDSLDGVTTPGFGDEILGNYRDDIFGEDMILVGDFIVRFEDAEIDGDAAEVTACVDGSGVVIIPEGGTVEQGATGQLATRQVFSAVRETSAPTGWLIDGVQVGEAC